MEEEEQEIEEGREEEEEEEKEMWVVLEAVIGKGRREETRCGFQERRRRK